MTQDTHDIVIAGGGIAGMIATLVFAQEGFSTLCVDPAPAPGPDMAEDLRSTAFLTPAVALLSEAGVFAALRPHAAPLRTMRLIDAGGARNEIRETVDFSAGDIGAAEFGWNIPNALLRRVLLEQISAHPNAEMRHGIAVSRATARLDQTILRVSDGSMARARLLIAADGRDSQLREAAGITARRRHYGQKALVFAVRHALPHDHVSTEIHRTGGPFTLVPLAGADQDMSAVVWMEHGPEAARLRDLPDMAFARAATNRSCGVLGDLRLASDRGLWPIISQEAARLHGDRMALIAEAAHVVPPIGAQGLNMSLGDIRVLRDLARKDRGGIGSPAQLAAYDTARRADIRLRINGIDALNRAAMSETPFFRDLRVSGLKLIGSTGLKQQVMGLGLGAKR